MEQKFFQNCVSIQQTENMFIPHRFTQNQLVFYKNLSADIALRAQTTAGVKLEFLLEEGDFTLAWHCSGFARAANRIDIYEDNHLTYSQPVFPNNPAGTLKYNKKNAQGACISIWLPAMACTGVNLTIHGTASPLPSPPIQILCLGDSITQGIECRHPSNTYVARLGRHLNAAVLNQGVGMFYFDSASLGGPANWSPQYITVAYGTNDYTLFNNSAKTIEKATQYFSTLKTLYPQAKIAVISPLWRQDIGNDTAFLALGQSLLQCALQQGFQGINGQALLPHNPSFFTDGLHPNDEGFAIYAQALLAHLAI